MALMTVAEWAKHVGADRSRAYKWIKRGKVKLVVDTRRHMRIDSETPAPGRWKNPAGDFDEPANVWSRIEAADVDALRARYGNVSKGVRAAVNLLLRGSEGNDGQ